MDPGIQQLVDTKAQQYGVPVNLGRAVVMQESGGNPNARSPVGAGGLMQLMPGTAKGLGVTNLFDPEQNVDGGMRYLSHLLQTFKDPRLALAAYNAGPGAVHQYGGVPPYKETQNYVNSIMNAAWGPDTNKPTGGKAGQGQKGLPPRPMPTPPTGGQSLADLLQAAGPSAITQSLLQHMGGTAGKVVERAAEPIPLPAGDSTTAPSVAKPAQQDPYSIGPHVQAQGLQGNIPMTLGGQNPYTNLHFAGHVDFQHVNPRLLDMVNKEAKKIGKVATIISGYRDNNYSAKNGGFTGDPHTKGLAIDAYIGGHPIGDVIPPDVWAKYGIRSGNTPGFFKGKPDPEHLDLIGVPIKGGPSA